jgi:hypothetical protein
MYQEYVKDNKNPLPLEEWIKQHEVKEWVTALYD